MHQISHPTTSHLRKLAMAEWIRFPFLSSVTVTTPLIVTSRCPGVLGAALLPLLERAGQGGGGKRRRIRTGQSWECLVLFPHTCGGSISGLLALPWFLIPFLSVLLCALRCSIGA